MAAVRLKELDALRGIAALAVVLYHYFYRYHADYGHSFVPPEFFELGKTGVYLFFMLSGFVIFWSIRRSQSLGEFAFSRFSRIFPVYWAAVIVTFLLVQIMGPADREVGLFEAVANLSMLHEYAGIAHVDNVYWTLTIELTFYLLAGLALALGLVRYVDWICLAWLGLAMLVKLNFVDIDVLGKVLLTDYCQWFVAGIALYRLWSGESSRLPLVLLGLFVAQNFTIYEAAKAAFVSAFAPVLWLAITGRAKWLTAFPLVWLGSISYALYLIHQNIGYGLIQAGYQYGVPAALSIALVILFSLCLAQALTHYVEQPLLLALRGWRKGNRPRVIAVGSKRLE